MSLFFVYGTYEYAPSMAKLKKNHKKAFVKPFGYEKKLEGRSQEKMGGTFGPARANSIHLKNNSGPSGLQDKTLVLNFGRNRLDRRPKSMLMIFKASPPKFGKRYPFNDKTCPIRIFERAYTK